MPPPAAPVDPRRRLPQVQRLLDRADGMELVDAYGRTRAVAALREVLAGARAGIATGAAVPPAEQLIVAAAARLASAVPAGPCRVINATGIVLHTNLGRAPLAPGAIARIAEVAGGYCDLEFDLATGTRGSRTGGVEAQLCALTGAQAALAVNNGAAAVLLALAALGGGGEVIVSRGELVEIGGGFRIPDVIRQGGARLVEVGATNKVRIADYRAAIGPDTRVLLKVHQSNFRMVGFVAEVDMTTLARLAREHGLLSVADIGSGLLTGSGAGEPSIAAALAADVDLVICSGDKLLGGPQAGLILGSAAAVAPLRRHPLLRAVRLDKLSLTALAVTLDLRRDCPDCIPVAAMLAQDVSTLQDRAERLAALVGAGRVIPSTSHAGGGALPGDGIVSRALALPGDAEGLAAALRRGTPPVVGRIAEDRLLLDLLAVDDGEVEELAAAVRTALA